MVQNEAAEYLRLLSRNKFFAALSRENQVEYLKKIEGFAMEKARLFSRRFAPINDDAGLKAAAACLGIRVRDVYDSAQMPILAEYEPFSRTIRLYHEKITAVENFLKRMFPAIIAVHSLCSLCLAHEIFHHIEHASLGATGRLIGIPAKLLWLIPVRRAVAAASEAAAHLFVKELLNLEYSPVFINKKLEDVYV